MEYLKNYQENCYKKNENDQIRLDILKENSKNEEKTFEPSTHNSNLSEDVTTHSFSYLQNQELSEAFSLANLIETDENIGFESCFQAINVLISHILQSQEEIEVILSVIAKIFSLRPYVLHPFLENCDFLLFLLSNFSLVASNPISTIINLSISQRCEDIIPWLISEASSPFLSEFPMNNSFLSIFIEIHNYIPINYISEDIHKLNEKAFQTIISQSTDLRPMNILKTVVLLLTRANIIDKTPQILQTIQDLVFIINTKEAFKWYRRLSLNISFDFHFILKCLQDFDHFPQIVDYLHSLKPNEMPIDIINILILMFDVSSYETKLNIFHLIEPYATVLQTPEVITISSFFIDDSNLGSLALHTTILAFMTMNENDLEKCIEIISEKEEELDTISMNQTTEGYYASFLLECISSYQNE